MRLVRRLGVKTPGRQSLELGRIDGRAIHEPDRPGSGAGVRSHKIALAVAVKIAAAENGTQSTNFCKRLMAWSASLIEQAVTEGYYESSTGLIVS